MRKPVLYLDVVGTLLLEKGGELTVAPFAKPFVEAVKDHFQVKLLTTLEEHHALRVSRALGLVADYLPYRHALGKASSIRFDEVFFWVDDDPGPEDLLRLSDERCSDRLIPVNRREGVTEGTLKKLLNTFRDLQGAQKSESSP